MATSVPNLQQRIEALLANVAEEIRPCKACGMQLAFVRHKKTGRIAPYVLYGEHAGVNHFIDCPCVQTFKKQREIVNA
jgi:hypothetical protein